MKEQETRTEGAGALPVGTVTEANRPHGHLEIVAPDSIEVQSAEQPRKSVTVGAPGEPVVEFNGQPLPEGARVEQVGEGQLRIHLPQHLAMPRMKEKVAIIGFTPSKANAPWGDPNYEFWGLNALYVHQAEIPLDRFTRWFDVHEMKAVTEERLTEYRKLPCPVYLQEVVPGMPHSVRFPKDEIEARFGTYFTNSISWEIAFALLMGFTTIEVYGVDMAQDSEYRGQRPNVEYFLGVARGMGVEVKVAETSDLLHATHQYGYGTDHGLRAKLKERLTEFNGRENAITEEIRRLELAKATVNGAKQNVEWMIQSWTVADHTSMMPDVAKVAPGAAVGGGA